jgi:hypothetical protein
VVSGILAAKDQREDCQAKSQKKEQARGLFEGAICHERQLKLI